MPIFDISNEEYIPFMKITPNASPDELSSPFFTVNKEFCSEFETYISNKNGDVKGNYNAWSYLVFGKITHPKNWNLTYKKATFTTSGNLLLSSKYQSLLVMAVWETDSIGIDDLAFEIRRKTVADFFKVPLSSSLSNLRVSNKYVIKSKINKSTLLTQLIGILEPVFITQEIYKIDYINKKLRIELRSEKHHFDIFNKLIDLLN